MSKSKNVYQGTNVQRIHRSELDDNKLRDLAREEVRLGENLKTVERARTVMMKSMDADKQLFIKAGAQSSNKVNKSSSYGSAQKLTSSQSTRVIPEQKVKRTGSSEQNDPSYNEPPGPGHGADRQRDQTDSIVSAPLYDTGSVYDQLFEANAILAPGKRASKSGLNINLAEVQAVARNDSQMAKPEDAGLVRTQGDCGTNNGQKGSDCEQVLGRDHSMDVRRSNIWETLSTPKHVSMTKAKRTQVEREFLRPTKAKPDQQKRILVTKKITGQSVTRKS
ncbi:hypothetical protein Btru_050675 [Bulinus truncatus]|nr:hypothetical protein Btru_050675 [Bulinus truncatus]